MRALASAGSAVALRESRLPASGTNIFTSFENSFESFRSLLGEPDIEPEWNERRNDGERSLARLGTVEIDGITVAAV